MMNYEGEGGRNDKKSPGKTSQKGASLTISRLLLETALII